MMALGEAASHLTWLTPCAGSLLALARGPAPAAWPAVRGDPGCVLLLARQAVAAASSGVSVFPSLAREPEVLDQALALLESRPEPGAWADWTRPDLRPVYHAGLAYAHAASALARRTDACDADNAWASGLLAPLGWLAAAAVDPEQTATHLRSPGTFDAAAVARRLSARWRLPGWLTATAGHLGLPAEVAQGLGAEPELFRVVQLAVALVQRRGAGLGLAVGACPAALASSLGVDTAEAEADCAAALADAEKALQSLRWEPPQALPLLPDLLRLAAENRRLAEAPSQERLHEGVDVLHAALEEARRGEEERLQARKLSALAEFAAGAGHEINNPLAVISGQAQYLLRRVQHAAALPQEPEAFAGPLQAIIGQTQRIHQVLGDLMQFARPPAAQRKLVDVAGLLRDAAATAEPLAAERKVRLTWAGPSSPVALHADMGQLLRAVSAVVRNAVEHAPADGWAAVRAELPRPDRLELIVEDNGRGLSPPDREHLFDPFYSGRKAGRGRGLGLPTAWRLARQNGGDLRLVSSEAGLTRFAFSLPLAPIDVAPLHNGNGHHAPTPPPHAAEPGELPQLA